jgi:hypothetical protein
MYRTVESLTGLPRFGGVARRTSVLSLSLAGALLLLWLLVYPHTPDLAAQVYRVDLFNRLGFTVWDERWYAGHDLPAYSLLFPALGSLLGLRLLAVLAALGSSVLFARISFAAFGPGARWGAAWFAVGAVADVWLGRLTFALGVTFALAAVLALMHARPLLAALLALLCAAASPVAALLLALAGLTRSLEHRSARELLMLGGPGAVVVVALALLFGEGGFEPFPFLSFLATAGVTLAFLAALSPRERLLRIGGAVYLLLCLVLLLVHTPVGSNVERYGVLLAGPLLLCAALGRRRVEEPGGATPEGATPTAGAGGLGGTRGVLLTALALCAAAVWVAWGPVRETEAVWDNESTSAAYYAPVERFLEGLPGGPVRVEVPLTRSHWEAALLAPSVSLARGWEKQLDGRYDEVLLRHGLTASAYLQWLRQEAVTFVALPDTPLDPSSGQEGRLIRGGLSYLKIVFQSAHWRIYRVLGATPLLSGPGRLTVLSSDSFSLDASSAGNMFVRVHFSRYLTVAAGAACVAEAPGGFTRVSARAAGSVTVSARFTLSRALGGPNSCALAHAPPVPEHPLAAAPVLPVPVVPYRWVVPIAGRAPSIARENAQRGTRAWRLPGPASLIGGAAHGPVEGYVAEQAVAPGETERVYINDHGAHTVRVQVFRMGWYGGKGGRLFLESRPLHAATQPPCTHRRSTGLTECRWHATLSFPIPAGLPSGVYIVKLSASNGAQSDCLFVVRSTHAGRLLVEIPTASYEAYNAWGGDSLYPGGSDRVKATGTNQGVEVSYDRPYATQTGAGQFFIREVAIVRFLERYGYPVSYTTIESIDGDPRQVDPAHALIDVGHSEYWSERDEHAFLRARDRGTSLIFLSSDTMAWRVRFARASSASSESGRPDHVIVAYKEFASRDPDRSEPSGLFPGGGAGLVGSSYNGCITPRLSQPGPPVYRYFPWTPAPSLEPSWLFKGSGVTRSTRIGGIVGYELDQTTPATPPGTRLIGYGTGVPCLSEHEPSPARGTIAQTTLYQARSGALVFATGTLGWLYGLSPVPQASPEAPRKPDRRVVAMTRNLLAHVLHLKR